MQILLPSFMHYSRTGKRGVFSRGFTLVELLVVCAIIALVSMIVLVKYKSFNSGTLLKGAAYEVGLAIRDVQARSVSGVESTNSNSGRDWWGVSFKTGTTNGKTYTIYRYRYTSNSDKPFYTASGDNKIISSSTVQLPPNMYVSDLCFDKANGEDVCSNSQMDISFSRPDFTPVTTIKNGEGQVQIKNNPVVKIQSMTGGSDVFLVSVSNFGQINVEKLQQQ